MSSWTIYYSEAKLNKRVFGHFYDTVNELMKHFIIRMFVFVTETVI